MEGLPEDIRRIVEELVPAKMRVETYERNILELGREIADEKMYRREVGLSDMEDPDLYNEKGRMPRPWVAACENLGIKYNERKDEINMKQTIEKSKKQTDRAEKDRSKSRINIEELQGIRNGDEDGKTEVQNGES
jgi:hypothetical protein